MPSVNFPRTTAGIFVWLAIAGSGAYEPEELEQNGPGRTRHRLREEVVELAPGEYVEHSVWDRGHMGYDRDDREIPLPDEARLVVRWFNGKILFVTKGSMWNGTPATYDGRHDTLASNEIRAMTERSLPPDLAVE